MKVKVILYSRFGVEIVEFTERVKWGCRLLGVEAEKIVEELGRAEIVIAGKRKKIKRLVKVLKEEYEIEVEKEKEKK
jgi:acylphosphatase